MTIAYLKKAITGPFNTSTGTASLQLTPPAGQFWIPRIIRVGIQPANAYEPPVMATVYHGGTGDTGIDAFVDATANGYGDATGIMNDSLVQPGEYITANWTNQDLSITFLGAASTAFLSIEGFSANTITEAIPYLISSSPGQRFQSPAPTPTNPPPAAANSALFNFNNPGLNNTVVLFPSSSAGFFYIYSIGVTYGATGVANTQGYFTGIPVNVNGFAFDIISAGSISSAPVFFDHHGMRVIPGGLAFFQTGSAAVNSLAYGVTVAYREQSI